MYIHYDMIWHYHTAYDLYAYREKLATFCDRENLNFNRFNQIAATIHLLAAGRLGFRCETDLVGWSG